MSLESAIELANGRVATSDVALATHVESLGLVRAISDGEIRLLDLHPGRHDAAIDCTMRIVPLAGKPQYEALSYVWGESSGSAPIRIQNHEVLITTNLYAALRRLRGVATARTLWVDQLCINQQDEEEKRKQVLLMGDIYKQCVRCLIWFGEIPSEPRAGFTIADAEAALSFIRDLADVTVCRMSAVPDLLADGPNGDAVRRAFGAMFMYGNVWWSRIWTVQEATLPPSARIGWGPLAISWDTLRRAAGNLSGSAEAWRCMHRSVQEAIAKHDHLIDHFMYPVRGLEISRRRETPLNVLQRWRYRDATEPQDKLYALMGLFSTAIPGVRCSYSTPPAELFRAVTLGLIELEGGLRPLIGLRGEPHVTLGLPSWSLDLVHYDYGTGRRPWKWWTHSHRYKTFAASGKHAPDFDGGLARGVFVDTVAAVGDVLGSETWNNLSDACLVGAIQTWEVLLRQFLPSIQLEFEGPYVGGGSVDDAFWRVMLGNWILREFPRSVASKDDRQSYDDFLREGKRNHVYESLRDMVVNQAFFVTATGYIGLGPPNLVKGDEVWVLCGGNVPFVLRPQTATRGMAPSEACPRYFLGDAYVHGIMHGEAVVNCSETTTYVRLI